MPRAVDGTRRKNRRKAMLKFAKGYWGTRKSNFKSAKDTLKASFFYAHRDRRNRKRDFRVLWIARISGAVKSEGINYSRFIYGLKKAGIELNRKALSNMAIEDKDSFKAIVVAAKKALA